ncbi:polyamine ABC transporter substrate-binding protein [Vogesella sp. LIG4]|uniref:polyamine ABC transporter substrate-binding protein n=1 Tax=Vogesella sp. LIG4 TaxID=1192162 RepID=UPI00081F7973|nr:polyamine ABC transporter substrate-binding protein [Vogesella sp. LIG4]SCK21093.1 putrescine transport system substrate-binding protein [Vogesella sp. LIG4]
MKATSKTLALATACALSSLAAHAEPGYVNVYNWGNSIAKDTNANFSKATGIKVRYSEFDSNDTLQAKLLAGNSGYDVVVPSDAYFSRQIQSGLFRKLDKSKIPNIAKLDPHLMSILAGADPGNLYGIPLNWGTDGIGINEQKVQAALGKNAPLDSWDLLFKPEYVSKLSKCGVSVLDSPLDAFGTALFYLKKNPMSSNPADYQQAFELLKKIRPYITQFNSSTYINDLAGGDVCMAFGWSGDVNTARLSALAAKKPYSIKYLIPKEGTAIWFDVMAVPKNAPNPDAAMKWINHAISEKEAAALSNETFYPSAVPAARKLLQPEVLADTAVYPDAAILNRTFSVKSLPVEIMHLETRLWQQLKTLK